MLLDPFEKQFDLPPASIKRGDGNRGQGEVVGQKHQPLVGLGVAKSDATQRRVEVLARGKAGEHDGLIANQPRAAVDGMRITALCVEIRFGARHKEAAGLVQAMQPFEVDVASVHDVEGARLGHQQVEDIDVVKLASADVQKRGDVAAKVQERVQLDGRLGRAKRGPRKHRQAQVDGAGIERVDRIFQIDAKRLPGIKTTGDSNERLGQVGIDAPVAHRVRIGQGVAGYAAADAHVIELARLCSQASFDVAQAFAIGKLRERHAEILIEARKRFDFVFAPVTRYAATKRRQWQMLHDLRENQLAHDHRCPLRMSSSQDGKCQRRSSNRDRNKAWIIYSVSISCGRTIDRRWDTTAMHDLLKIKNLGRKSAKELSELLHNNGLRLGMTIPGWSTLNAEACRKELGNQFKPAIAKLNFDLFASNVIEADCLE